MPAKPVRLQLSRRRGFNLQALSVSTNGLPAISVARPGPRGNPFRIGVHGDRIECVEKFRAWAENNLAIGQPIAFSAQLDMVRGKNVACFCALDQPCHGDVWLDLANRPQR